MTWLTAYFLLASCVTLKVGAVIGEHSPDSVDSTLHTAVRTSDLKLKGREKLGDLDIEGRKISRWVLRKQNMRMWTNFL
jgi:hypothetical protein